MNKETLLKEFKDCIEIQTKLNDIINPDWQNAGYDFILAARQEAGEAIDHYGWKWWKKQEPNIPQCKIELVDIFHFLLSASIVDNFNIDHFLDDYFDEETNTVRADVYERLDCCFIHLMTNISNDNYISENWNIFFRACDVINFTLEEMFKLFKAKAVLNEFRQANGYKEGVYVKDWGGVEDNDYLLSIYDDCGGVKEILYAYLACEYVKFKNK